MISAENERPVVIGLTGNIATGKSTVAKMLANLGARTIDADKVAHRVMRPGTQAHKEIVEAFGSQVLTADGEINRKQLGNLVFTDEKALARLEAIVHPATLKAIDRRVAASTTDVVVIEAIKLIESGLADRCDSVWVTTCRPDQQIERIMADRGMNQAEARQRVEAQRPQEERVARADVVIDNAGPLSATWEQVLAAWQHVVEDREGHSSAPSWI